MEVLISTDTLPSSKTNFIFEVTSILDILESHRQRNLLECSPSILSLQACDITFISSLISTIVFTTNTHHGSYCQDE